MVLVIKFFGLPFSSSGFIHDGGIYIMFGRSRVMGGKGRFPRCSVPTICILVCGFRAWVFFVAWFFSPLCLFSI